jgi:hypothetical protein
MEKHVSPGTKGPPDNVVWWPHGSIFWATNPSWCIPPRVQYHKLPVAEVIETKAPNGKLSVLQKRDHQRRRDMGFQVYVIWTMEQAEIYLRSRGKK